VTVVTTTWIVSTSINFTVDLHVWNACIKVTKLMLCLVGQFTTILSHTNGEDIATNILLLISELKFS